MSDPWDPAQYHRFRDQRAQPFHDLVALVRRSAPDGKRLRAIDLGCGTAELSAALADALEAEVVGIDRSLNMLAEAPTHPRLRVEARDIADLSDVSHCDLLFSNAALHWVPGNEALLARWLPQLAAGAQVAIQLPKNHGHPSHTVAEAVAGEPEFRDALGGFVARSEALSLERYAEILFEHGFREQVAIEKIYGHAMERSGDVVEWVKGTLLTAYLTRLDESTQARFLARYRERLLATIGDRAPYFFPFRRLLVWGIKG